MSPIRVNPMAKAKMTIVVSMIRCVFGCVLCILGFCCLWASMSISILFCSQLLVYKDKCRFKAVTMYLWLVFIALLFSNFFKDKRARNVELWHLDTK